MAGNPALTRRSLLAGLVVSACGHKRASRYQGWLFVASGSEKEIAVADLASFRPVASIPLPCVADQLFRLGRRVFVLCREGQAMFELDGDRFRVAGKIPLPGKPVAARFLDGERGAIVLTSGPDTLLAVDLMARRVVARLPLPGVPADLDLNGNLAAITIPSRNAIQRVTLTGSPSSPPGLRLESATSAGVPCDAVRFRRDGRTILAGATAAREIVAVDAQSGALLTRLSLPVSPSRFCFNPDGGQMFVTGAGEDALAIVSPFQNEVDETILAGHTPDAMTVSDQRNLLLVTNRESGDLTVLDIETRRVVASVHVGENPGEVLLTPDGEYALVLDTRSGNVSVVRLTTVLDRKIKTKPLFTVFPTAAAARSALIVPFQV